MNHSRQQDYDCRTYSINGVTFSVEVERDHGEVWASISVDKIDNKKIDKANKGRVYIAK